MTPPNRSTEEIAVDLMMIVDANEQRAAIIAAIDNLAAEKDDKIHSLEAEVKRLGEQCRGLAAAALGNGQDLLLHEAKVKELQASLSLAIGTLKKVNDFWLSVTPQALKLLEIFPLSTFDDVEEALSSPAIQKEVQRIGSDGEGGSGGNSLDKSP